MRKTARAQQKWRTCTVLHTLTHLPVLLLLRFSHSVLWGLLLLLVIMSIVLSCFTCYHFFLALSNATTNERSKKGWIAQGINVHSHHELFVLSPFYDQIQNKLRGANRALIVQAFTEAQRDVPEAATTASKPEVIEQAKKVALAASVVAQKVYEAKHGAATPATASPAASSDATVAASAATAAAAAAPAAGAVPSSALSVDPLLFPSGPYSPSLTSALESYYTLKLQVVETYNKLQLLQRQEFTDDKAREKVQGGMAGEIRTPAQTSSTKTAPISLADVSVTAAAAALAEARGLTLGKIEPTEGCVPSSSGAPPDSESEGSADADSKATKRARAPNPYSLGAWGNLLQLLFPPREGERVPLAGGEQEAPVAEKPVLPAPANKESKKKK